MRILILGGNGFIGRKLTEHLLVSNEIIVFDKYIPKSTQRIPNVKYISGDFQNFNLLQEAINNVDVIYHLISATVPYTANQDPFKDFELNLISTVKFLHILQERSFKRLIYLSSGGTVYGDPKYLPISESHPLNPKGFYGATKLAIENYVRLYAKKYGFEFIIARPSNPYGPGQKWKSNQGVITKFIYNNLTNNEIELWGDGTEIRDYIYIDDLCSILAKLTEGKCNETYNIGSGSGTSLSEILEILPTVTGIQPIIRKKESLSFAVKEIVLDIKKIEKDYNFRPKIDINKGMLLQSEWLNKNLKI